MYVDAYVEDMYMYVEYLYPYIEIHIEICTHLYKYILQTLVFTNHNFILHTYKQFIR